MEDPITAPNNVSTQLAFDRTRLAYDRTMLAWVRTATSLITFGFSIYKFFDIETRGHHSGLIGPREFAIIMITIGLVSLLLATIQHRGDRNRLRAASPDVPRSGAAVVAALIAVLGIIALAAVLLRQ